MSVAESQKIEDCQICIRGNCRARLARAVPRVFTGRLARSLRAASGYASGRRELAAWLTGRDSPLTARVMVRPDLATFI